MWLQCIVIRVEMHVDSVVANENILVRCHLVCIPIFLLLSGLCYHTNNALSSWHTLGDIPAYETTKSRHTAPHPKNVGFMPSPRVVTTRLQLISCAVCYAVQADCCIRGNRTACLVKSLTQLFIMQANDYSFWIVHLTVDHSTVGPHASIVGWGAMRNMIWWD